MEKNTGKQMTTASKAMSNRFVYIVESPSDVDMLDGRSEGHLLTEALSLTGIKSVYKMAVSRETFVRSLRGELVDAVKEVNRSPILHLSAHGDHRGIQLTDKTFVSWQKLREVLLPINQVMNGQLLVCMSSCKGFQGLQMAMYTEDLPFFGLVGNTETPSWGDTAVAFVTFYHLLFKGVVVPDAVLAMRSASGDDKFLEVLGGDVQTVWLANETQSKQDAMRQALEELASGEQSDATGNSST